VIQAVPTKIDGRQFRSFLEAKWDCFFEDLEFEREYEPLAFPNWIPDFALFDEDSNITIFVEIKPTVNMVPDVHQKITQAAPNELILLVGYRPYESRKHPGLARIGWLCDVEGFSEAFLSLRGDRWDIFTDTWDRTSKGLFRNDDRGMLMDWNNVQKCHWNPAVNKAQWKANG
jgi:hypothetical protein